MILYFNQLLYIKIVMAWFAYKFRVPSSLNSEHRARYSIIKSTSFSLTHTQKESACHCSRHSFSPWVPLQYSCPGDPMDRGAWWVTQSHTCLSNWAHTERRFTDKEAGPRGTRMSSNARGQYYRGEMGPQVFSLPSWWVEGSGWVREKSGLLFRLDPKRPSALLMTSTSIERPLSGLQLLAIVNRASVTICA